VQVVNNDLPVIVRSITKVIAVDSFYLLSSSDLLTTDKETTDSTQIVYTIDSVPAQGSMGWAAQSIGGALDSGSTFTQAEINCTDRTQGCYQIYYSAPSVAGNEYLIFSVSDGVHSVKGKLTIQVH
jgi:hypothetical protein